MRMLFKVTEADRRLRQAPLAFQPFPFLWAEPHHAGVSLSCDNRSWQSDFSNGRSRITAWVASSRHGKGRGVQSPWLAVSQTCLSTLFNFQRTVGESLKRLSCGKGGRGRKEGDFNKSCPAGSPIPLLALIQYQNSTSF